VEFWEWEVLFSIRVYEIWEEVRDWMLFYVRFATPTLDQGFGS